MHLALPCRRSGEPFLFALGRLTVGFLKGSPRKPGRANPAFGSALGGQEPVQSRPLFVDGGREMPYFGQAGFPAGRGLLGYGRIARQRVKFPKFQPALCGSFAGNTLRVRKKDLWAGSRSVIIKQNEPMERFAMGKGRRRNGCKNVLHRGRRGR